jgi:hypothetical protein
MSFEMRRAFHRRLITKYAKDFSPLFAPQAFKKLNEDIRSFSSCTVQKKNQVHLVITPITVT